MTRRQFAAAGALALLVPATALGKGGTASSRADSSASADAKALDAQTKVGDLTLSHPSSWEAQTREDGTVEIAAPFGSSAVTVQRSELGDASQALLVADFSAGLLYAAMMGGDPSGQASSELGEIARGEAGDTRWYSAPLTISSEGEEMRALLDVAVGGGSMYTITYMADAERWEEAEPWFEAVRKSASLCGEKAPEKMLPWDGLPQGEGTGSGQEDASTAAFDGSGLGDAGQGEMYLSTPSGTSQGGAVPSFSASGRSLMQIGINTEGMDGSTCTVYVDGVENSTMGVGTNFVQGSLTLQGDALAPGTHTVELVREEGGEVAVYKRAQYEVTQ